VKELLPGRAIIFGAREQKENKNKPASSTFLS
jgi:hypothetical protein